MKALWQMTTKQKKKAAKEFLELHQAATDTCKITFEINGNGTLEFYSVGCETLYAIEQIIMFAAFYQASVFCSYDKERNRTIAHVH